jgi:arsenate reductase
VKKLLDEGMEDADAFALLATDGMLVKRPLLVVDGVPLTPGFREAEWEEKLL